MDETAKPLYEIYGTMRIFGGNPMPIPIRKEIVVFRVFGEDARAGGWSWTPVNPKTVNNFRDVAGLPSGGASGSTNSAEFMLKGTVNSSDIIKTRLALPLDGNTGGLMEYIINPAKVKITDFFILKP